MEVKKVNYRKTCINLLISIVVTVLVLVIGIKGIFFFMPFVIGWIISLIATPIVRWLEKHLKIVRKLSTAITIIIVLLSLIGAIYLTSVRLWELCVEYATELPAYYAQLSEALEHLYHQLDGTVHLFPESIRSAIETVISNLDLYVAQFITSLSEPLVEGAGNMAKQIPSFLVSFIIMIVAAYFFIADREEFVAWVKKVTPMPIQKRMGIVNYNLVHAVGGYFKAQFQIMGVIGVILFVAFFLMSQPYAMLKAVLIALLDFFPVLGTGTVLIPWMIFELVMGNYKLSLLLLVLYIVTLATHQLIQPKLVADSVGLNPIFTLVLLYVGYRLAGVLGMVIIIPIGLITLNLVKAGAFDYITDDIKILIQGIMELRK